MKDSKMRIPVSDPTLTGNEAKYIQEALDSGWISSKGEFILRFEKKFAEYCGVKYACSCNNGTSALHLALLALGIKEGDEVIVPVLTYIASINVIRYCNAKPVFVDAEEESWNIDSKKIEEKITPNTKAIIAVHLYGVPCNMDEIMKIAKKYNLKVIEDCAEAIGAEYNSQKVGSIGDIGCFSFFGNKVITTGEGGMCTTNNLELLDKMELYKNQGMSKEKRYWHPVIGYNYRMTNIQAAIGLAQLEQVESFLKKRELDEEIYRRELNEISNVTFSFKNTKIKPIYWMHTILLPKRKEIMEKLENAGIETRPMFIPVNKMPPYESEEKYFIAEKLTEKGINLPSSIKLKEDEIVEICNLIKEELRN